MAKFQRADIRAIIGDACTEEMENRLMALHHGVLDPLLDDVAKYKNDAEKLQEVQKKLDGMEKDGYKQKYEEKCKEYDTLVAAEAAAKIRAAKEKAVRAYFESKNIVGANLELAMRGCGEEMTALELDGEKIKDTAALDALIAGDYKGLVSTQRVKGSNPATPPKNTGGGVTRADVLKMSYAERAELYEKDPEQFSEIMKG